MIINSIITAWREVKAVVLGLVGILIVSFLTGKRIIMLLSVSLLGFVFYFFRDPERTLPSTSPDLIFSPADGVVTEIELEDEPLFFKSPARRITLFLSIFDVHVQRIPYAGEVKFMQYQPGSFAPAFLKEAENNEANIIALQTEKGPIVVKQIAGILARRIVCWIDEGDKVGTGERFGLIRFGSRVDLFLPPDVEILVSIGQHIHGGHTVIARWK